MEGHTHLSGVVGALGGAGRVGEVAWRVSQLAYSEAGQESWELRVIGFLCAALAAVGRRRFSYIRPSTGGNQAQKGQSIGK